MNFMLLVGLLFSASTFGQDIQSAIKKTDNEMYTQAEMDFRALIAKTPEGCMNYLMLGDNFYAQENLDSAKVYWKLAGTKEPACYYNPIANGKYYWMSGDQSMANEQFLKALTMTKNKNAEVMRLIAKVYITAEKKNLDEAIVLLEKAIKLDPKNEDGYLLYGDALLSKTTENASNAIKQYNKVLEINPNSARGLVRVGKLYYRVQSYKEGNEKYMEAQKVDPTYAPAYRENAELWMKLNNPKNAIENWKKYLELNNSIEARYRYVTAMFLGKLYCDAIPALDALKKDGFNTFYMERMLAYSYAECTDDKDAFTKGMAASDELFKMAPADKILYTDYRNRAQLYVNAGKDSLAILEYEKSSAMDEKAKKDNIGSLAKLYIKNKKYDKAIEAYLYKATLGELNATENFDLGRAYYVTKNYAMADTVLGKLTVQSPTFVSGFLWRARSCSQMDLKTEKWLALPHYQKVFELIKVEERATTQKANTLEAARYLGDYYNRSTAKDLVKAKEYFTVVKELDPNDALAKDFFLKNK